MMAERGPEERVGGVAGDEVVRLLEVLVEATQVVHDGALSEAPIESLREAMKRRVDAYERLRVLVDRAHWQPNAVERVFLDRLRALDGELLALGRSLPEVLRVRRHGLHRRRSAVQAHAVRGREEPRVVTVKA